MRKLEDLVCSLELGFPKYDLVKKTVDFIYEMLYSGKVLAQSCGGVLAWPWSTRKHSGHWKLGRKVYAVTRQSSSLVDKLRLKNLKP